MAIGDTVQAGLGRMDFSAFQTAGEAQARANQAFGDTIGGVVEKYQQNKKEGEAADMQIGAVLESMSPERQAEITSGESELGKSLSKFTEGELPNSKKKALLGSLMTVNAADKLKLEEQRKAQLFQQQQQVLQQQQQANKDRDGFITRLTGLGATGNLNEEGQQAMRDFQAFASPNDQRINPYRDKLLSDPRFQEKKPIMEMEDNRFLNQFQTPGEKREALKYMQARQKAEADLAESNRIDPKDAIDLENKEETTRQLFDKPLNDLSANFDKNKQVQDYKNVVISYNTISSAAENPSAAGDLSLIFQYMKVLDPGSTVREGEFANAQNAAGVPDRIRNMVNNWSKGQRLDEKQRQDFITQAKKIVDARGKSIDPLIRQTRQKFDRTINKQNRNLAPDQANLLFEEVIFPDIRLPQNRQPQGQPPQVPSVPQASTLPGGGIFTPIGQ